MCKGTQQFVHRSCLDHWRSVKADIIPLWTSSDEGFSFSHCTTCKAQFHLRVELLEDHSWRKIKFRIFVARDIVLVFLAVQIAIAVMGGFAYFMDKNGDFRNSFSDDWDRILSKHLISFYYCIGVLAFFVLLGFFGLILHCSSLYTDDPGTAGCRNCCYGWGILDCFPIFQSFHFPIVFSYLLWLCSCRDSLNPSISPVAGTLHLSISPAAGSNLQLKSKNLCQNKLLVKLEIDDSFDEEHALSKRNLRSLLLFKSSSKRRRHGLEMKDRQRWQPEEDAVLGAYVKRYGAKEWNLVSHRMGKPLDRDAKSCLERWKNYLKPGIKKGSLTSQEQSLVISLQAKYGNKWKKIASQVPGRTAKRLAKWWEVFKEKQLKLHPNQHPKDQYPDQATTATTPAAEKYDHILETFAEKYVKPKLLSFQPTPSPLLPPPPLLMPNPTLSLGSSITTSSPSPSVLPPWMNSSNMGSSTSSLSPSSSTPSPSVSLSLSPSEPSLFDSVSPENAMNPRFFPVQQMGMLVQCCKELEEGRQSWLQHKKEATWRLSRLEQQLESEKARKRREKMEEVEAKIRCLREEEMAFLCRIESDCRDQLNAIQRDAESKEAKLVEIWSCKHVKLSKIVEQMGSHNFSVPRDLH
ncbi:hypothetical protein HHK36_015024 [Tetracentron sinense]|uniref:Uncharacterized protein n=1 Tax=Tetracentron sinense TaxID=13715 RepID=A0A834Z019_TETSI|nr:hypothetical protein HHK36_015024 [Tetracentron sinense]